MINLNVIYIIMNSEYNKCINQSLGPGSYKLNQPITDGCYNTSSDFRIQKQNWLQKGGSSTYNNIVDVNSELKNITRNLLLSKFFKLNLKSFFQFYAFYYNHDL